MSPAAIALVLAGGAGHACWNLLGEGSLARRLVAATTIVAGIITAVIG